MRSAVPFMILVAVSTLPAREAPAEVLADCAAIEAAVERLACYDRLAREAAGERDDLAVWSLEAKPSRLNPDLTDLVLWNRSVNETPGASGTMVRPVLALECRQGDVAVWFDFGRFVGGGAARINYRIGSGAVLAGDVTVAPDHRRFGVWERERAIGFVKALYGQPQLRLRVAPPTGDALIAAFDLAGIEDAVAPLQEGCAWE